MLPGEQVRVSQRWLLKLHGDIGGAIVFTRNEYHGATATHSALRGIVQAMLMTRHLLVIHSEMMTFISLYMRCARLMLRWKSLAMP